MGLFEPQNFTKHRLAVTGTALLMLAGAAGALGYTAYSSGVWVYKRATQDDAKAERGSA
jgi:hypothetical protein